MPGDLAYSPPLPNAYRIKVQRDVEARESLDLDIAYIIGAAHNTEQDWAKAHHRAAQ